MSISRRQALRRLLVGGAAGVLAGAGGYGFLYERHQIRLVQTRLPAVGLPAALAGLRIGILTDIHRSAFLSANALDRAVSMLMSARPHLVALLGDYVTWRDRTYVQACAESLGRLRPPHGVFAVLGNHDDEVEVPRALARRGFTVLDDTRTRLTIGGETVEIAGINFWTRRPADIAATVRGAKGTVVLLAHDPRRLVEAAALDIPIILSGHTHGGQVVLPFVGAIAARKYPVAAGMLGFRRTSLFVSRGVGTVFMPYRLNCPPEAVVLTLEPRASGRGV